MPTFWSIASHFLASWLLWFEAAWAVSPGEKRSPPLIFNLGMRNSTAVYFNDYNSGQEIWRIPPSEHPPIFAPAVMRMLGGIQYFFDGTLEPRMLLVQESLEDALDMSRDWRISGFIYRLSPGPHFIATDHDEIYNVIGGIAWSQIIEFAFATGDERSANRLRWIKNIDYDPRWEGFGVRASQPAFTGGEGEEEQLERLRAAGYDSESAERAYMNELTGPRNTDVDESQREILRELLDWDPVLEPDRNFPLLRRHATPSLTTLAIGRIDWMAYNITRVPRKLRTAMFGGIVTLRECNDLIRAIFIKPGEVIKAEPLNLKVTSSACKHLVLRLQHHLRPANQVGIANGHEPVAGPSTSQDPIGFTDTTQARQKVCDLKRSQDSREVEERVKRLKTLPSSGDFAESLDLQAQIERRICSSVNEHCGTRFILRVSEDEEKLVQDLLDLEEEIRGTCEEARNSCRDDVAAALQQPTNNILRGLLRVEDDQHDACAEAAARVARIERRPAVEAAVSSQRWEAFVREAADHGVSAEILMATIDSGMTSLRVNYPTVFRLMQARYPIIFQALWNAYVDEVEVGSCDPRGHEGATSKRAETGLEPRSNDKTRAQLQQRACQRLMALTLYRKKLAKGGPCLAIDKLRVKMTMTWKASGGLLGTQDTISVGIGRSKFPIEMLESPWGWSGTTENVSLKDEFNASTVALNDLRLIRLISEQAMSSSLGIVRPWYFKELTLIAHCADVNKQIVLEKYSNHLSPPLQRNPNTGYQEVWRGEVRPEWWRVLDHNPGSSWRGQQDEVK